MKLSFYKTLMPFILALLCFKQVTALDSTFHKPVQVSILLPLYLDSLFNGSTYKYGNTLPKFALPALEFYNGVQMAADSLKQEGLPARIEIIDSRNPSFSTAAALQAKVKPQLLIGIAQGSNELKSMASAAQEAGVPLISATYPNDAGITGNPNLLIINSTLKTHCNAIYKYLQSNFSNSTVLFVTRKGNADDRIKNYFKEAEKMATGLKPKLKMISLSDTPSAFEVSVYLDSTKNNTIVGASLDRDFAMQLVGSLSNLKKSYKAQLFGMPTWDDLPLERPEFKSVDVFFSTPFISYSANVDLFSSISARFKKLTSSKPSDMVFKGFEITYRYVKTLYEHPDDFMQHVSDNQYKLFAAFNFEKKQAANDGQQINYWENNRIYIIKKSDGVVKVIYN